LVFTDIEGSTRLVQHLDVRYADVLEAHRHIVQSAVAGWNGYVVDTQGDSFFLAFHRAPDAVAAAVNIQRAITEHHWPEGGELRVRIGVHTGSPPWRRTGTSVWMSIVPLASAQLATVGRC